MFLEDLRRQGISDERVLDAMAAVPRARFLPPDWREYAGLDRPLPIGCGQTISQPFVVALMTQLLALEGGEKVLEIGTGSGYQTAILCRLAREVWTVEVLASLAAQAGAILDELGGANLHRRVGDGWRGWPEEAPYEAIIVTAAPEVVPETLLAQLGEGGRMVLPVGPAGEVQTLLRLWKHGGEVESEEHGLVRFVPMVGGACLP